MQGPAWIRLGAIAAVAFALCACSAERSRAVRVSEVDEKSEKKDYRAMLEKARERTAAEDSLGPILAGLDRFRSQRGRLPTNLAELVTSGMMTAIPPAPSGMAHLFDPHNGNIRLIPATEPDRITLPDDGFQVPSLLKKP
jgi:hypothetical protein